MDPKKKDGKKKNKLPRNDKEDNTPKGDQPDLSDEELKLAEESFDEFNRKQREQEQ